MYAGQQTGPQSAAVYAGQQAPQYYMPTSPLAPFGYMQPSQPVMPVPQQMPYRMLSNAAPAAVPISERGYPPPYVPKKPTAGFGLFGGGKANTATRWL